jgi:hypothetical protein
VVQGRTIVLCYKVGACVTGSWCFHPVGAGTSGSWCFLLVGARETRGLVLSTSCSLLKKRL